MMSRLYGKGGSTKIAKNHDELLKRAFRNHFVEFLRFIYDDADDIFDFSRGIEFMDKELLKIISDRERRRDGRVADLLVKVYLRDGSERWILIHTEIEGGHDIHFSFRMFQYNYRILDTYQVHVESIAFLTGDRNQSSVGQYKYEGLLTSYDFRYKAYQIFDHNEEDLLAMDNIFAYIVLACQKALLEGKVPEDELAAGRSLIFRVLFETGKYNKEQITEFIFFLKSCVNILQMDKMLTKISLSIEKQKIQRNILSL